MRKLLDSFNLIGCQKLACVQGSSESGVQTLIVITSESMIGPYVCDPLDRLDVMTGMSSAICPCEVSPLRIGARNPRRTQLTKRLGERTLLLKNGSVRCLCSTSRVIYTVQGILASPCFVGALRLSSSNHLSSTAGHTVKRMDDS